MNPRVRASFVTVAVLSTAILIGVAAAQKGPGVAFEVASIRSADFPTPETMRSGQFRTGTTISNGSADFE